MTDELFAIVVLVFVLLFGVVFGMSVCEKKIINLRRPIKNRDHKFGEPDAYYRTDIATKAGVAPALFTANQIEVALARAERNPEDVK